MVSSSTSTADPATAMGLPPELLFSNEAYVQVPYLSLMWKLLLVFVILLNYKNFPLVFHVRVINALRFALGSQRKVKPNPGQLFQPIITSSRTPLTELDYNFHKSNSTYFSDLDIARSHLVCTLFSTGIEQARCTKETGILKGGNARFGVWLGAVSCSFRKEVKPYQRYEMWTRVLSWDHKWIYIVTHFVRQNKPKRTLSTKHKATKTTLDGFDKANENLVFASALSKCVFKKGRVTVPPETMLRVSGLLPSRSVDTALIHIESTPAPPPQPSLLADVVELFFRTVVKLDEIRMSIEEHLSIHFGRNKAEEAAPFADNKLEEQKDKVDEGTWEEIECERQRGMEMANLLAGLGGLETEFRAEEALATHRDL